MNIDFQSLSIDPELPPGYDDWVLMQVPLRALRIMLRHGDRAARLYRFVPVEQTPHYQFVVSGDASAYDRYMRDYGPEVGYGTEHNLVKFKALTTSLQYLKPPYERSYIVAEVRMMNGAPSYVVLDGFHRLAILAARGETTIPVIVKNIQNGRKLRQAIFVESFKTHSAAQHEAFLKCAREMSRQPDPAI